MRVICGVAPALPEADLRRVVLDVHDHRTAFPVLRDTPEDSPDYISDRHAPVIIVETHRLHPLSSPTASGLPPTVFEALSALLIRDG